MTPDKEYSGRSTIRMFNVDNRDFMNQVDDNYYDLAICDPPYGIGDRIKGTWGKKTGMNEATKWDYAPDKEVFNELFRTSKNQLIWGANYFIEHLHSSMGVICWDKMNGTNNLSDFELCWTSFNEKTARMFRMHHFSDGYDRKIHPTQKPSKLYRWILKNYSEPNQKIFDGWGGSMSIAIACWDLGFDLDICELDKDYFDAAVKRFESHISQQVLF